MLFHLKSRLQPIKENLHVKASGEEHYWLSVLLTASILMSDFTFDSQHFNVRFWESCRNLQFWKPWITSRTFVLFQVLLTTSILMSDFRKRIGLYWFHLLLIGSIFCRWYETSLQEYSILKAMNHFTRSQIFKGVGRPKSFWILNPVYSQIYCFWTVRLLVHVRNRFWKSLAPGKPSSLGLANNGRVSSREWKFFMFPIFTTSSKLVL